MGDCDYNATYTAITPFISSASDGLDFFSEKLPGKDPWDEGYI